MSLRYALTSIVGTGTDIDDPLRSRVYVYAPIVMFNAVQVINTAPTVGLPRALVLIASTSHGTFTADPDISYLPDLTLDAKVSTLSIEAIASLNATLAKWGIPVNSVNGSEGYRQVIDTLGRQLDPMFDSLAFNVSDV